MCSILKLVYEHDEARQERVVWCSMDEKQGVRLNEENDMMYEEELGSG